MALQVKENVHFYPGDQSTKVVTLEFDGLEYVKPWIPNLIMEPYLIDPMLDEIGITLDNKDFTPDLVNAVKEYCLQLVTDEDVKLSSLKDMVWGFIAGYRKAKG